MVTKTWGGSLGTLMFMKPLFLIALVPLLSREILTWRGLVGLNTQTGSVNAITENSWHMSNNCYNYKPDDPQVIASCEGASSQLLRGRCYRQWGV